LPDDIEELASDDKTLLLNRPLVPSDISDKNVMLLKKDYNQVRVIG